MTSLRSLGRIRVASGAGATGSAGGAEGRYAYDRHRAIIPDDVPL